jgi:hypothetical protein
MDGKKVTIVAIVHPRRLLVGYLMGPPDEALQGSSTSSGRARGGAEGVHAREELSDKLAQMEAQLKQLTDDLAGEGAARADAGQMSRARSDHRTREGSTGGAMQAVVIGIVAAIIGLGIGYFTWGTQASQATKDVAAAKAQVDEALKAAEREGQLATKIQAAEAKLKETQEASRPRRSRPKLEGPSRTKLASRVMAAAGSSCHRMRRRRRAGCRRGSSASVVRCRLGARSPS